MARQQVLFELEPDQVDEDYDELAEILSNSHLNNNFLALAREVFLIEIYTDTAYLNVFFVTF